MTALALALMLTAAAGLSTTVGSLLVLVIRRPGPGSWLSPWGLPQG